MAFVKKIIKGILKKHGFVKDIKIPADRPYAYSKAYDSLIYFPYYNLHVPLVDTKPAIYSAEGRQLDIWFIRDVHGAHCPYGFDGGAPKYFLWDRYDIGLDTHFYTHNSMLETMGRPRHRYGYFVESETIVPNDYKIFETHRGLWKDFDAIFTWSEDILNTVPNAKLFTSCAGFWYGNVAGDPAALTDDAYLHKAKNISDICSNKLFTKYHHIRHRFAEAAAKTGLVDMYGTFEGGAYLQYKSDSLKDYRFQIVVENGISPYYFTEKILDCFAAMTVPIYLGAPKIAEFFNADGIIFLKESDYENLESILTRCDETLYEEMLPAVKDNYARVLKYINTNDRLYEEYFANTGGGGVINCCSLLSMPAAA